jgi:menaquinone-dependent protoporphyrinogen IX oxidase
LRKRNARRLRREKVRRCADGWHAFPEPAMKVLIVYYSRTGRTRRLAARLAREFSAPMVCIGEQHHRLGTAGWLRSLFEATFRLEPEIARLRRVIDDYDLVLIGTPVWGRQLASPVRSFARQYGHRVRQVAFFCTMGCSGQPSAFADLQRELRRAPQATLALSEDEVLHLATPEVRSKVERFVRTIRAMQPQTAEV